MVVRRLVTDAGLAGRLAVQADTAGRSRPVRIVARGATVRDVLADIAIQAHLGMLNDPGMIRLRVAPDPR